MGPREATINKIAELTGDEWLDWYLLTPEERWREADRLWDVYLAMGGSLDPEPDTQSPFYFLPS